MSQSERRLWARTVALTFGAFIAVLLHGVPSAAQTPAPNSTTGTGNTSMMNITNMTLSPSNMTMAPPNATNITMAPNATNASTPVPAMKKHRTMTKSLAVIAVPMVTTPAPTLNADDFIDIVYSYYGAMILSIPSYTFDPDSFVASILGPAIKDKSFATRVLLLSYCGVMASSVQSNWAYTTCSGIQTTSFDSTFVTFTFANNPSQINFTSANIQFSALPLLSGSASCPQVGCFQTLTYTAPTPSPAPGFFSNAADDADTTAGVIVIIIAIIILVCICYFIIKWVQKEQLRRQLEKGGGGAVPNHSSSPDGTSGGNLYGELPEPTPPAPGVEMASRRTEGGSGTLPAMPRNAPPPPMPPAASDSPVGAMPPPPPPQVAASGTPSGPKTMVGY